MLLAQHHDVVALDVVASKVDQINERCSPIEDNVLEEYLRDKALNLKATLSKEEAYVNADFVVIATPTDYDTERNYFNTSSVESVIRDVISIAQAARVACDTPSSCPYCSQTGCNGCCRA